MQDLQDRPLHVRALPTAAPQTSLAGEILPPEDAADVFYDVVFVDARQSQVVAVLFGHSRAGLFSEVFLPPDLADPMGRRRSQDSQQQQRIIRCRDDLSFDNLDELDRRPRAITGLKLAAQPEPAEKPWLKHGRQSRLRGVADTRKGRR